MTERNNMEEFKMIIKFIKVLRYEGLGCTDWKMIGLIEGYINRWMDK